MAWRACSDGRRRSRGPGRPPATTCAWFIAYSGSSSRARAHRRPAASSCRPTLREDVPQVAVRGVVAGVERDRPSQRDLRSRPVPVEVELDDPQRGLRLGEVGVGAHRARGRLAGAGATCSGGTSLLIGLAPGRRRCRTRRARSPDRARWRARSTRSPGGSSRACADSRSTAHAGRGRTRRRSGCGAAPARRGARETGEAGSARRSPCSAPVAVRARWSARDRRRRTTPAPGRAREPGAT